MFFNHALFDREDLLLAHNPLAFSDLFWKFLGWVGWLFKEVVIRGMLR